MTELMDEQEAAYRKACAEVEAKRAAVREFWLVRWPETQLTDKSEECLSSVFPLPERPKKLRVVEFDDTQFGGVWEFRVRDGVLEIRHSHLKMWCDWKRSDLSIDDHIAIASLKDRPYED